MVESVLSLLGTRDGSLWVGASNGFGRRDGDSFEFRQIGRVNALVEDAGGGVWIALSRMGNSADGPLCRARQDTFQCFGAAEGIGFRNQGAEALTGDSAGGLWIGTTHGVAHWNGSSAVEYFPKALERAQGSAGILALELEQDGSLLVGAGAKGRGAGLQGFLAGTWSDYRAGGIRGSEVSVTALLRDRDSGLWIGTADRGLLHVHNGSTDNFTEADGLSSNSIQALYEDREGDIWAVSAQGLDRFRELPIVTLGARQGLSGAHVTAVFASPTGRIWLANRTSVDLVQNSGISSLPKGKLPGKATTSILEDREGRLWLGTDDELSVMEGGRFRPIRNSDGKPLGIVFGLVEGADSHIYAVVTGRPQRVFDIRGAKVIRSDSLPSSVPGNPFVAHPSGGISLPDGKGGLLHYQNGNFETTGQPSKFKLRFVHGLADDQQGAIWGASGNGVVHWAGEGTRLLTTRNGLTCNAINSLIFDDAGALWLSATCGIMSIAKTELRRWVTQPNARIAVRTYDVQDGAETGDSPFQPPVAKSPDGRLWFVNETAVQTIDPTHLPENQLVPPVLIENVQADGRVLSPHSEIRLPARTKDLRIDYTALSFVVPQKVRFRYKLEGRDDGWQDVGTRRQAFYTDLPPRAYLFHVMACNNGGLWNEVGASLAFSVAPAFYQTLSFQFTCGVTGLLALWLLYRLRLRQLAAHMNARFDERIAERNRLAGEFHDTILQTIQATKLIAANAQMEQSDDPALLRQDIDQIFGWLEQATAEARAALHALRNSTAERNDLAEALKRAAESALGMSSMKFVLSVAGAIRQFHPIVRDEIYRIGCEAMRNASLHSEASQLSVAIAYGKEFLLQIRDDGKGMSPDVVDHGREGHYGLRGMRERASRIHGTLRFQSRPGAGTEVVLSVPAEIAFPPDPALETPMLRLLKGWTNGKANTN